MPRDEKRQAPAVMVRYLIDVVGLRQREIAEYLGVTQAWVSNVYHKKRKAVSYGLADRLTTLYNAKRRYL